MRALDTVLVVQDGRVMTQVSVPGHSSVTPHGADLQRLYPSADRTLVALDLLAGTAAWTTTVAINSRLLISPDGSRGLLASRDDIAILDLDNGAIIETLKSSTTGGRTRLLLKDIAASFLTGFLTGVAVDSSVSTALVFSAHGQKAMALASTGEMCASISATGK